MTPLHHDPAFTFRFAEDRLIDRIHLDGVAAGTPVTLADLRTGEWLADAVVGEGGWVPLAPLLVVRAGGGFVARPTQPAGPTVSHPTHPPPTGPPR